jgi:hypothetical protein
MGSTGGLPIGGPPGNGLTSQNMAAEDRTDDAPLIDLNEASIKKLISKARRAATSPMTS